MNQLLDFIERNIIGKKVLILFILTNIVYAFMLMVTIPRVTEFSSGLKLLDMMPLGYDFNYVNGLFSALGEIGRETYLTNQIPVDMIYPALFGFSNCLLLGFFLKKINKLNIKYSYLCLLPLIAGIFDYFENIGIILMLNIYPSLMKFLVSSTNMFTIVKSVTTSLFFVALVFVLISFGIKTLKSERLK